MDISTLNLIQPFWGGLIALSLVGLFVWGFPKEAYKLGLPWKLKALLGLPAALGGASPLVQWLVLGVILGYDGTSGSYHTTCRAGRSGVCWGLRSSSSPCCRSSRAMRKS